MVLERIIKKGERKGKEKEKKGKGKKKEQKKGRGEGGNPQYPILLKIARR
jgi:hypothetical protein